MFPLLAAFAAAIANPPHCPSGSQREMIECAAIEAGKADRELNRQWPLTVRAVRETDKEVDGERGPGFRPLGAYQDLLKAQRAWIAYRDAECDSEADQARGGRDTNLIVAQCSERLTRERARVLKDLERGYP